MEIKEVYYHWIPKFFKVPAIPMEHTILYKEEKPNEKIKRHYKKHCEQQQKHGIIIFILLYTLEYFKNLADFQFPEEAIKNVSYEKEAKDAEYLDL